jgi:hypothetical protein
MYVLARPKQERVIALLIECCSIRAIERIWYNFGRIHGSLRCTPAMAAGIARRPWKVGDLVPAD